PCAGRTDEGGARARRPGGGAARAGVGLGLLCAGRLQRARLSVRRGRNSPRRNGQDAVAALQRAAAGARTRLPAGLSRLRTRVRLTGMAVALPGTSSSASDTGCCSLTTTLGASTA